MLTSLSGLPLFFRLPQQVRRENPGLLQTAAPVPIRALRACRAGRSLSRCWKREMIHSIHRSIA